LIISVVLLRSLLSRAASRVVVEAPKSPRTLFEADVRFSKGVKVGIGSSSHAMVKTIPEEDLNNGLELFCRGLVLTCLVLMPMFGIRRRLYD